MNAIARIRRSVFVTEKQAENSLNTVVLFCAVGLAVSLVMLAIFGLNLSPGVF